jgi:NADH-quinone oxidoreductase subunit D
MTAAETQDFIGRRFPEAVARPSGDCPAFDVPAASIVSVLRALRDEAGFDLLTDLCGVDRGVGEVPRFAVVYHLLATADAACVRLVTACPEGEPPSVPSVTGLWSAADWHEREAYDMFGIRFDGHANLRRILMWDGYPHHPLRKDFPLAGVEGPLPDGEIAAETGATVQPAPMAGGPFVAPQERFASTREPQALGESWSERDPKPAGASPAGDGDRHPPAAPSEFRFAETAARAAGADAVAHGTERLAINMGPSHPSTHGVLRLMLELDGETVVKCDPVVGYLHRGDEKIAENTTYNQFVPYTDRLDYLAPLANNVAYAMAVERLAGLELPPRAQAIRALVCEMARLSSHLLGVGVYGMDVGAMTIFLVTFTEREKLYNLFEELTGARFTTSFTRIGGTARDVPEGWLGRVSKFCDEVLPCIDQVDGLLTRNRIFLDRTEGVGVISKQDAIAYGLTGANLRASGVALDLRKAKPYLGYERYEFDVPLGSRGDCFDRYIVRMEEMRQSVRIIRQIVADFPGGPWHAEGARRIFAPPKDKVLTSMEELIQNFMIVTQGPQMPPGEVYFEAENPKGILGFFIVSKGGGVPFRLKIRSPSFCSLAVLPKVAVGHLVADLSAILGSLDFVMGESDR